MAGKIGGTATSRGIASGRGEGRPGGTALQAKSQTTRADTATATTALFPFQLSVYLQPPFNGAADQTCPWGVVTSHQGDVRQCPATTDFWRPPARRLGDSSTVFHAGDVTEVLNDTSLEISGPNFTEIVRGNMTNLLAAAQALIPSASLADSAPSAGVVGSNGSAGASITIKSAAGVTTLTGSVSKFTPIRNLKPCTELSC